MAEALRREAGQSVSELERQLASAPRNRLYPAKGDESKSRETLSAIVQNGLEALQTCFPASEREQEQRRVDLTDAKQIRDACEAYLTACSGTGVCPTFSGLCACLGYSRKRVYEIMRIRKDKGTEMLSYCQSLFASIMEQGGLSRSLDAANAIFALKNSGQGFTDRVELSAVSETVEPFQSGDPEQIAKKYLAGIPDPLTIEGGFD